jgi:dipeptidyl aminopeptidase/acylaminoacyl peptidase
MQNRWALSFLLAFLSAPLARADILPGESLIADGIPPIPDAIADEAGPYGEARSATPFDWHPQRRELLIGTRFGDTVQAHRVAFPLGARTQLTFFRDRIPNARFPPDPHRSDHFVFTKDVGGGEFFQLYRYDLPSGKITLLTDGKSRNALGPFSRAGMRLAYTSTRRNGRDTDLYVIDPRDPKSDRRLAVVEGGGWSPLDWSPDGRKLLVLETISVNESYLWLFDAADGQREPLVPHAGEGIEKVRYEGGAFAADGRSLFTTTDRESEFLRLVRFDLATRSHRYLSSHIQWDVQELALSRDGKTIAVVTNEDGAGTLHLFDAASGGERPRPKLPPGAVADLRWHPSGRDLAFALQNARSPSDVYSLEVASGKVQRWTESELGGIDTTGAREPELIKWKSFDGRTISGYLYLPSKRFTGPRPVVINIHGGPESQFRPGWPGRARYLLDELGVAVIHPNVRGSTGYGKSFTKLDNAYQREDSVKDIGALLDWIPSRGELDAKRIMVTGGSYGGYMSLAVSFRYADRLRCSVDVVGISNFISFLERTEAYRRDLRRVEYGDEREGAMRAHFQKISPLTHVREITKPIFVVQGKNDPRVPLNEAEQIVATLKKQKTPVWYLVARDEGHGFAKKKNQDYQFFATVAFMKKYLLGN